MDGPNVGKWTDQNDIKQTVPECDRQKRESERPKTELFNRVTPTTQNKMIGTYIRKDELQWI